MTKPRIVLWDIETVMNKVATFRLLNQDMLPHRNILQERYVVSAAWKELGTKKVNSVSVLDFPAVFKKDPNDDTEVLRKLHQVLSAADVIIAHNGDQYDIKFTETRMLIKGFEPLPPIPSIDTLKVARNRFYFNSNRLDYLGQVFGIGHKKSNEEDLWLKVLAGNVHAIKEMVKYNKVDVDLLEQIFLKLQPYVPNHIHRHLFSGQHDISCPQCGSTHYEKRGYRYATTNKYARFYCLDCGRWFRSSKAVPTKLQVRPL